MNRLRPNTTAKNFKEFLLRGDNINKSAKWKAVSRKLHPKVGVMQSPSSPQNLRNAMSSSSISSKAIEGGFKHNFKTTVLNAYDPTQQRVMIQNLLSTYDTAGAQNGKNARMPRSNR